MLIFVLNKEKYRELIEKINQSLHYSYSLFNEICKIVNWIIYVIIYVYTLKNMLSVSHKDYIEYMR